MSDVTLSYKGDDILELSDSGSATLKTGGTYCEADIEVEYVKPSGGGSGWELLADHTTTEDVSSIQIDFTSAMQGYDYYAIVLEGQFNRNEYPCPAINGEPTTNNYINLWRADTVQKACCNIFPVKNGSGGKTYRFCFNDSQLAGKVVNLTLPISYFKVMTYYTDGFFKTGFNVKVYGVMMP